MDKKLSEMTDEELKDSYLSLYESIHIVECFGSRDIVELAAIEGELIKRGYVIRESLPESLPEILRTPPKCPECGKPLETVIKQVEGEYLEWNSEDEIYEVCDEQAQGSFICPECGKVIGTWRADGETWGFEPEIW